MTHDRCALCGERVGDRRCPALDKSLCSLCCGSHRGKFVRCPSDCTYGRQAEQRLREKRAQELERAWALWYRDLSSSGSEAVWPHVELLAEALAFLLHRGMATDPEVEGALRHLDQALSPVVLVSTPPSPLGRALAEEGLLPLVKEGKFGREDLRKAAHALSEWLGTYRSDDPLRFARGLLGLFPPQPQQPQGLIVRPPGTA